MKPFTRVSVASALALGVVAALLGSAAPSSAYTGEGIKIKLGQTLKLDRDPIPGNSTTFQANYQVASSSALPADCAAEPVGCEIVPIELDVPQEDPDEIEAQGYILTVVVDWDPGQRVDNVFQVGTVYANDLESFLFQNPLAVDSAGNATFTARSNTTQPASLVAVSPTSKKFQLAVANFSGINNGYTLRGQPHERLAARVRPQDVRPWRQAGGLRAADLRPAELDPAAERLRRCERPGLLPAGWTGRCAGCCARWFRCPEHPRGEGRPDAGRDR